ncbi:MAG: hypothetical protein KDK24_05705 [Pseudooceanicola sp.]|nr:hypothetical protein [Pseudooceanicola sp.]
MTITIKTGNTGFTDFLAYLDAFDADYTSAGRGGFSNGFSGDYASSEGGIGETGIAADQGYIARGNLAYSLATHVVSGTIAAIEFGHGATANDGAGGIIDYALSLLDYTISFAPDLEDPEAHDVIYGLFGSGPAGEGKTDPIVDLLKTEAIVFKGSIGNDVFAGYGKADTLNGLRGSDTLKGRAGADELNGGAGRDILVGGRGADDFNFTGQFGRDIIRDFQAGRDDLDFSKLTGEATSLREFKAAATEVNGRVIYDMDGDGANVIVLLGVSLDDLHARDFIF